MELTRLSDLFEVSPAVRLLKSHHAAFVLHFCDSTFKHSDTSGVGTFAHDDLRRRLACYQEDLADDGYEVLVSPADHYLTTWADEGWLRRFLKSDSNEPHYQLTRHTEDAIRFVDSLLTRQSRFVGTESRLRLVIDTLSDIVRGASDNPDRRLEDLKAKRAQIDHEIAVIEAGGSVETYDAALIRDRFQTAVELLKTLQGDFRAVEDRFEQIAKEVHAKTQVREQSRGRIPAGALDAEDLIKQEDEGVSFYAFVTFLFSPTSQERLRNVIDELVLLPQVAGDRDGVRRIRGMLPSLLAEADNVLRQTGGLSETLRRLLDADSIDHRQRVAEVLRDIRATAASLKTHATDSVAAEEFFPRRIPADLSLPTEISAAVDAVQSLRENAQSDRAGGYRIEWQSRRSRSFGQNAFPHEIYIDSMDDR